ncbi:LacI family DNA-binding transcriptional regulator [Bilifractor porci]|jgi:LacI family transcriptional regulator|uniref:LacI family transcriptional regulator n=1 Tax=Bilifractor porci TaxID=2606636 RepID=A0A7X2P7Y4_9FIRM|nr:LacI family DNA-binding transcriptional regulator [Bilifractor porci]MST81915.1 LacI family transcriptional regulator [Bilifractor porci]
MGKKVTIRDIAKESGVSTTTVSRLLNHVEGYCSKDTEQRVWAAIERLNYHPSKIARSLVTQKTNLIGVIFPDIYNSFFQDLFRGVEEYASRLGYQLILCNTDGNSKKERDYLLSLAENLTDGIIISTSNAKDDNTTIVDLHKKGFPIVTVERYGKELKDVPRILFANREAEEQVVDYLYRSGHRRIAYISGPSNAVNANRRQEGFRNGLSKNGLLVDDSLILTGDYKLESGQECMRRLLDEHGCGDRKKPDFTAVMAGNDLMAIGAVRAILERGLQIPDDISVIGCDGTMLADLIRPQIGTIRLGGIEMGKKAAEYLISEIKSEDTGEKKVIFQPQLHLDGRIKTIEE